MDMKSRKFSSPRDEALEIAYRTREAILDGKSDVVSVLRSCSVIASNLKKTEVQTWINSELSGYSDRSKVPSYRVENCRYEDHHVLQDRFREFETGIEVHVLASKIKANEDLRLVIDDRTTAVFDVARLEKIVASIIDRCLFFLNDVISELQYGGVVEYLMEEIRRNVDEKLVKLDKSVSEEASSIYTNLPSTNPVDWSKVAHSCRRILKFIADKVFPPADQQYKMKDGMMVEVGDKNYINRLCAFVDQKSSGGPRKFVIAEAKYLADYMKQVVEPMQKGEHEESIEKLDAEAMAIHTYLIINELLKLT
nr:hypothetical protein [Candidatus Njordarchaeota archaeon]